MMLYLDYNSTMPLKPKAKEAFLQASNQVGLNPSAIHNRGRKGRAMLEEARRDIAGAIGVPSDKYNDYQIVFTSGATEANNIVINSFDDCEIFISSTEHSSIMSFASLKPNIKLIKVNSEGMVDVTHLEALLANSGDKRKIVSVAIANNETGVIAPLAEIKSLCSKYSALLHSDCAQAIGKIPCDIAALGLDLATFSSHKFGGPTGVGLLVARAGIRLKPSQIGGGQERGMRAGTENVAGILAMRQAMLIAVADIPTKHMLQNRAKLEGALHQNFPQLVIAGQNVPRLPNTSMLIMPSWNNQSQVIALDMRDVYISMGSACSSGKVQKITSLTAMGYSEEYAGSAIRVSGGPKTSEAEIDKFVEIYSSLAYIWQNNNKEYKMLKTGS